MDVDGRRVTNGDPGSPSGPALRVGSRGAAGRELESPWLRRRSDTGTLVDVWRYPIGSRVLTLSGPSNWPDRNSRAEKSAASWPLVTV